jgi:predicted nucleotidyltransferase
VNDGLREDQRAKLCGLLAELPGISRAWLFGSRATGKFRPSSDVDLALESVDGGLLGLAVLLRISSRIEDLNLPMEVDLVDRAAVTDAAMLESISREGVLWWEAGESDEAGL